MWPRSKGKNRRHARDAVLEVKMRSRDVRRARIRALTAAVGVVGGTALGTWVLWQAYQWALLHFVYRNETYAIRRIVIRHEGRLREDQIRRWADVSLGQNLIALDLDRVRHDLELNPWIAWADVQSERPDCLRISAWEREPVAQVVVWRWSASERRAWPETNFLDEKGFVLPPLRPEWVKPGADIDFSYLPRLTGLERYSVIPGQPLQIPAVTAALQLIQAYENSSLYSLVDLEQVDVSGSHVLQGQLREGTRVSFGWSDFDRQMRRWRSIHDYAQAQARSLQWLDLSVTNNLPARWHEDTNRVVPIRPAKPKRNPKRHV